MIRSINTEQWKKLHGNFQYYNSIFPYSKFYNQFCTHSSKLMEIFDSSYSSWSSDCRFLPMPQLCSCHFMCKVELQSHGWNFTTDKLKLPSNLNCDGKIISYIHGFVQWSYVFLALTHRCGSMTHNINCRCSEVMTMTWQVYGEDTNQTESISRTHLINILWANDLILLKTVFSWVLIQKIQCYKFPIFFNFFYFDNFCQWQKL